MDQQYKTLIHIKIQGYPDQKYLNKVKRQVRKILASDGIFVTDEKFDITIHHVPLDSVSVEVSS